MPAQWHRCQSCRGILPVTDFDEGNPVCRGCEAKAARAAAKKAATPRGGGPVTVRTVPVATKSVRVQEGVVTGALGRGDREVRVRRARLRALEKLAEVYPEEFEALHAAERAAEGL
jgi:hypothetical protein